LRARTVALDCRPLNGRCDVPLVSGFEDYEDDPDAPYYRSQRRNLTPAQTWAAIAERIPRALLAVDAQTQRGPLRLEVDRLCRWHRGLFAADFHSAGQLRTADVEFAYLDPERGRRARRGTPPDRLTAELTDVCGEFNEAVAELSAVELPDACATAARLYARLLAIHPFEDGNGRVSYVALQAALRSQGVRWVNFAGAVREHDECLGAALVTDRAPDYRPLTALLVARIALAGENDATISS
jgi:fido (protein-threonine AMPylation protein)